jgi:SAM-dependent methyltransferase
MAMTDQTPPDGGNAAQIAYWNERAGATWVAQQERLDRLFQPITDIAVQAAAAQAGDHVIDVGCGCGATLLALGDRVGSTGSVLGLDVSAPMSARAQERIAATSMRQARVMVGDAATATLQPEATDLLFSRFGVMFFDDPAGAFGHLRRAVRRDGRLLFVVWRPLADNPWFRVPMEAARPLVPPQPAVDPHAPGPFALADADRTQRLLEQAGWRDVALDRHDVGMQIAPAHDLEGATDFAVTIGPLARMLGEMAPDARIPVREQVMRALRPYDSSDGFVLTGSVWTISARV